MDSATRKMLELLLIILRPLYNFREAGFSDEAIHEISKICASEITRLSFGDVKQ